MIRHDRMGHNVALVSQRRDDDDLGRLVVSIQNRHNRRGRGVADGRAALNGVGWVGHRSSRQGIARGLSG
jgi:hypothetical protein